MGKTNPKELIASELAKETPDWRLIEKLTRQEIAHDPENVRFSVDAGHIQRLGVELVGKKDTALSELIKNAYDADGTNVQLQFHDCSAPGGSLVISDDGSGMTIEVIRDSWMRISTDAKLEQPVSPVYKRRRAGRKGIGRFAVQRLARRLELRTKPSGEPFGFLVTFNWDDEFLIGRDLNEVFSRLRRFDKPRNESGTELRMLGLRDAWTAKSISNVWRAVLLLQPPFRLARVSGAAQGVRADPGFVVRINGETNESRADSFSIEKDFLSQALASIDAEIRQDGSSSVRVVSKKLGLDDTQEWDKSYEVVGPTKLSAKYFIYRSATLSGLRLQEAVVMGRRFGGVRVYRNGFRVLPYGEPNDDWLSLDSTAARRGVLAPGNNSNFFGQISIDSENNPYLEETASREGLQENEAFEQLRDFTHVAVVWAIKRVAAIRERKQTATQPKFVSKIRSPAQSIRTAIEIVKQNEIGEHDQKQNVANKPERATELLGVLRRAEMDARSSEAEFTKRIEASLQYEAMLRLLASLGLSISVFAHEVKGAQEAIRARLQLLYDKAMELPEGEGRNKILEQNSMLKTAAERLFDIGGYIANLMSKTASRDLRELSVAGALQNFGKQFEGYMKKQKVDFEVLEISPSNLRTTEMHATELDSVLLNFLTNSIKSMKKARASARRIRVDARKEGDHIVIGFEDNGIGIPEEQEKRIFDAFYTTTMTSADDGIAGPGTGLGLKIVSDIATSYGGSVSVVQPTEEFSCRVEFRVLASENHK